MPLQITKTGALILATSALSFEGPPEFLAQEIESLCRDENGELWRDPMDLVRQIRNELMAETDWTQLPDIAESTRAAWTAYRQALRDLPRAGSVQRIVWPAPPG